MVVQSNLRTDRQRARIRSKASKVECILLRHPWQHPKGLDRCPEDHKGERRKSCSSRKKVCIPQKACEILRDAYEYEFKMESSDDDDDDDDDDDGCVYILPLSHAMGIPKMGEKEGQKEVGKKCLEEPLDTPIQPLECAHEVEVEVEHTLIKFMRVMSFAYGKSDLVCEVKHVIHNNVVCLDIQSRFEAGDVEMNEEEDVISCFLMKCVALRMDTQTKQTCIQKMLAQ
ncbi:hypothetical protein L7F22_033287 [Adiantum nelumboides]|nr:hypothetical protein [Adiantum nelumboides]